MKAFFSFFIAFLLTVASVDAAVKYTTNYASLNGVTTNTTGTSVGVKSAESFTVYWTVNSGTSSQSVTTLVEISPDGTAWFALDSQTKTASANYSYSANNVNAQRVRTRTSAQVDTTVTASITIGSVR